jgi:hypothetical protein
MECYHCGRPATRLVHLGLVGGVLADIPLCADCTPKGICECGCGRSLEGRRRGAKYYDDACKTRAFRERQRRKV